MIGEDGIEKKQHPSILKSGKLDWSESILKILEGMTIDVRMSLQSHLLRQARQGNLERYDTSVYGNYHQICINALHWHCFPSEPMRTHCSHDFSITVPSRLRRDVANTWKAFPFCIRLGSPGSRPSWHYYLPPVETEQCGRKHDWLHTSSSGVWVQNA